MARQYPVNPLVKGCALTQEVKAPLFRFIPYTITLARVAVSGVKNVYALAPTVPPMMYRKFRAFVGGAP